jgi:hypothetical protein
MPTNKGTWIEMGDELIHKRGEGIREWIIGIQGGITHVYYFNPFF